MKPVLEVNGLENRQNGALKLSDITLQVFEGELVSILGANGAGKTSLVGTISGQFKPSKGVVKLDGEVVTGLPAYRMARLGIGVAPQNHPIFPSLTVGESLGLSNNEIELDIFELFPNLRAKHNQMAGNLSGGERQMLSMAMAIMNRPKICLFDEPSSGLSPIIVKQVFSAIRKMVDAGMTILMVEQNARSALAIADRAYVMEHGKIIVEGQSQELSKNDHVKRAYLGF